MSAAAIFALWADLKGKIFTLFSFQHGLYSTLLKYTYKSEQEQNKAFGSELENNCNMWKCVLFLLPNNHFFWPNIMSPGVPKAKELVSKNDQWNFGYLS